MSASSPRTVPELVDAAANAARDGDIYVLQELGALVEGWLIPDYERVCLTNMLSAFEELVDLAA